MRGLSLNARGINRLNDAWAVVRKNGLSPTASRETRANVQEFERSALTNLRRIQRQLHAGTFVFERQQGVPVDKKSGGHRAIVVAPVQNRIVQRARRDRRRR